MLTIEAFAALADTGLPAAHNAEETHLLADVTGAGRCCTGGRQEWCRGSYNTDWTGAPSGCDGYGVRGTTERGRDVTDGDGKACARSGIARYDRDALDGGGGARDGYRVVGHCRDIVARNAVNAGGDDADRAADRTGERICDGRDGN
jgi:hypothetical protein